jgi:hypothetical protein
MGGQTPQKSLNVEAMEKLFGQATEGLKVIGPRIRTANISDGMCRIAIAFVATCRQLWTNNRMGAPY